MDSPKDWSFWTSVRAEARRTWLNRRLWLWIAAALALEAWLLAERNEEWFSPRFHILCDVAVLVPVWLCADLLSLRFRGNPEPHREWPPRVFLARALGRLLPFWLALLVLTATFTSFGLAFDTRRPPEGSGMVHSGGPLVGDLVVAWLVWNAVFSISAFPFAALAALLSATARRPRRGLIALAVTFVVLVAAACGMPVPPSPDGAALFVELARLAAPMVWVGYGSAEFFFRLAPGVRPAISAAILWTTCVACCAFVVYALPPFALTWWIAARRFRRHPYTVPTDASELDA